MAENKKYPENYAEEGSYVFCPVCGEKVPAGARFCMSCGSSLDGASNMEDVYGGPEYFEMKKKSMGRVYAGPEYFDIKDEPMAPVYAGPEYFEKLAKENEQKRMQEAAKAVKDAAEEAAQKTALLYGAPEPKGLLSKIMGKIKK